MGIIRNIKKTLLHNIGDSIGIVARSFSLGQDFSEWMMEKKYVFHSKADLIEFGFPDINDDIDGLIDPIADKLDDDLDHMEEDLDSDIESDLGNFGPEVTRAIESIRSELRERSEMAEAVYPIQKESVPAQVDTERNPALGVRYFPVSFVDSKGCPVIALHRSSEAGMGNSVKVHIDLDTIPRISDIMIYGLAVHIQEFESRFQASHMSKDPLEVTERLDGNAVPVFGKNLSLNGQSSMLIEDAGAGWTLLAPYVSGKEGALKQAGLRGYFFIKRSEFKDSQVTMELSLGYTKKERRDGPAYVSASLLLIPATDDF